jgi:hypothetical protein
MEDIAKSWGVMVKDKKILSLGLAEASFQGGM